MNSDKTVYEIELDLKNYYDKKNKENDLNFKEFECELVSTRIVQLLSKKNNLSSRDLIIGK